MKYMKKIGSLLCATAIAVTGVFAMQMPVKAADTVPQVTVAGEYYDNTLYGFYFGDEAPSYDSNEMSTTVALYTNGVIDGEGLTVGKVEMHAYDMVLPSEATYGSAEYSVIVGSDVNFRNSSYTSVSFESYNGTKVTVEDTDLSEWFSGDSALTSVDMSGLYISNVTDITDMFKDCTALTKIVMPDSIPSGVSAALPTTFYDTSGVSYTTMTSACAGETLSTTKPSEPTKLSQTFTGKKTYTKRVNAKSFKINAKAQTSLTYKSSKKKVATVNSKGKVTIKGTGTTVITVTAAESSTYKAATYKVKIKVKKLAKVKVKYCGRFGGAYTSIMAWKKMSNISGYQIQKSTSSKFAKSATKTYNVKKSKKKKYFTGLSNRKAYYFRIRAYKKIGKKKYYSSWSSKYVG
ncbi:MAG: hypothetical protein K6G01_04930 [Eubacterium sp.]|nr:hypothetical protein [Eubacterium sp.]